MQILEKMLLDNPQLKCCEGAILAMVDSMISAYEKGKKLLICGNGGSCADSEHIVGELLKGFLKRRPLSAEQRRQMRARCPALCDADLEQLQEGLPALSLAHSSALQTAYCNDVNASLVFAQQVQVLGTEGDMLLAISTSGNSENVVKAAQVAKAKGLKVFALTGGTGGKLQEIADVAIVVPATQTYRIQEYHLPVYHAVCAMLEDHFFSE